MSFGLTNSTEEVFLVECVTYCVTKMLRGEISPQFEYMKYIYPLEEANKSFQSRFSQR